MINKVKLKEYLEDKPVMLIKPGETIPNEVFEMLRKADYKRRRKVFGKITKGENPLYKVEYKCCFCGKKFIKEVPLTNMFRIRNCDECKDVSRLEAHYRNHEEDIIREAEKDEMTDWYLETFVNGSRSIKEYSIEELKNTLAGEYPNTYDRDRIMAALKRLKYADFLFTPYWKGVSRLVKHQKGNRCELCGKQGLLNVHHKTYEHHGAEIYHMDDLICLCKNCHQKFHDKLGR